MSLPKYRDTRICYGGWSPPGKFGAKAVPLHRVRDERTLTIVFGPATWKECCRFKQSLEGAPKRKPD